MRFSVVSSVLLSLSISFVSGLVRVTSTKPKVFLNPLNKNHNHHHHKSAAIRLGMGMLDDFMDMFSSGEPKSVEVNEFKRLIAIDVNSMKAGGLRFALGLHLMGLQGKPVKGTWMTKQADDDIVDMFHKSDTGSLAFTFLERQIIVERWGPFPSKEYLADESAVLHDFLDELVMMTSSASDVELADRLLELKDSSALEDARKVLLPR